MKSEEKKPVLNREDPPFFIVKLKDIETLDFERYSLALCSLKRKYCESTITSAGIVKKILIARIQDNWKTTR